MRKFIRASVLVLALAVPAFAGEIPYGVTGSIPNGVTSTGNIPYGVTSTGDIPNNATLSGEIPFGITGYIPYGVTSQPVIDALLSLLSLI
jgi:hypothetical protein